MKRKLEVSELIFKIISYTLLTVFALACLYPFIYAISAAISGEHEVEYGIALRDHYSTTAYCKKTVTIV